MFRKTFSDKVFLKTLTTRALPIVLQNLISFSVSMTDTVMLGFVGQGEMAAATLANAFFFVVGLMIFGFQSGESVLISQYWGKQDKKSILISRFMVLFGIWLKSCSNPVSSFVSEPSE